MKSRTGGLWLLAVIGGGLVFLLWWRYSPGPRQRVTEFFGPFQRRVQPGPRLPAEADAACRSRVQLLEEIDRLQLSLANVQQELRQTTEIRRENAELRRLLVLPQRPGYRYVVGRVISADPASGGRRQRLDRGRRQGLRIGQAALAGDSLIGRVFEVAEDSCLVITISDPNCQVPALVEGLAAPGILAGAGEERWVSQPFCQLKFLPRDLEYAEGARVVTSPFCETMPAAIPIGELRPHSSGQLVATVDQLYKNAWVKPFAFGEEHRFLAVLVSD